MSGRNSIVWRWIRVFGIVVRRVGGRQHHPRLDELEQGRDDGEDAEPERTRRA